MQLAGGEQRACITQQDEHFCDTQMTPQHDQCAPGQLAGAQVSCVVPSLLLKQCWAGSTLVCCAAAHASTMHVVMFRIVLLGTHTVSGA